MTRRNPSARKVCFRPETEPLEARELLSASGSLDTSFGGGQGYVAVAVKPATDPLNGTATPADTVALQADGKIVMAGDLGNGATDTFSVLRLNADGSPDSTFGQDGQVFVPTDAMSGGKVASVLVQADGKILVVGYVNLTVFSGDSYRPEFVIARLNADGSIDTSYGNEGIAEFTITQTNGLASSYSQATGAAIQPDGKLVIVGDSVDAQSNGGDPQDFVAVRLDTDGTLDTSFAGTGQARLPFSIGTTGPDDLYAEVAIRPNGQIFLSGADVYGNQGRMSLIAAVALQLNADGSPDTSFGGAVEPGQVILPNSGSDSGIVLTTDGKVVIAGPGNLTQLDADGTLDTTFGTGGVVTLPTSFDAMAVAIQADGKIVVTGGDVSVGSVPLTPQLGPVTLRYDVDGTLDATFGNTSTPGLGYAPTGLTAFSPVGLAVRPGGPIVVVGSGDVTGDSNTVFVEAQVLATANSTVSPPPPVTPVLKQPLADFDGSGKTDISAYIAAAGAFVYRPTDGSADVIVPFGIAGTGQTIPAPGDYTGAGHTEIAAYLPSLGLYAYRPADGSADVVVPFGIAGAGQSIPVSGDYKGTGRDDIAVYLPSIGAYAIRPTAGGVDKIIPFGIAGAGQSIPVPADYDNSGKTELGVYLPSLGEFVYRPANGGPDVAITFGLAGAGQSIPIPGDYDGSGKTEIAVYLPTLGEFAYRPADGGPDQILSFGSADGSIPVPGDYDGSGHDEIAVYDQNYASFAYRPSNAPDVIVSFGLPGKGQTLPAATPPASLAASLAPATLTIQAASVASTAVVPSGPSLSTRKASRTLVAQARPARSRA